AAAEAAPAKAPASAPAAAAVPPAAASADVLRREPKGGKLPYSDQAWAQVRKGSAANAAPATQARAETAPAAVQVRPDSRHDAKSDTPAEPKSDKPAKTAESSRSNTAEDGVEWGWPGAGKVLTGFNDSSSKGLDLAGKTGDSVTAAAAGKVVYAGTALRGYGKLLIVKHGSNYSSVYAHNSQLLVKEGQQVKRGQKIAELGDTDSDRPKLHFEIRRQGKPVDPAKYLPNR
ncbi:MAG: peptidoglycan DD-metalloendopeptidase family protein, partial [Zoogloea sp.]|nr:peptidoglycan DD-metalloendopeptidase family protein [Zoogloea sp.]